MGIKDDLLKAAVEGYSYEQLFKELLAFLPDILLEDFARKAFGGNMFLVEDTE